MESNTNKTVVRYRVRKEDAKRDSWVQPDPLDVCLDCWRAWMAGDGDRDLGAKTMRMLSGEADGYGIDSGEAQQQRNNEIGAATDAMIDSLSRYHQWAIYEMCGIATLWNYPNADLLVVGPAAREALTEKLRKNCGTRILF